MIYVIQVTVEVTTDTANEAYRYIKHALAHTRKAEIVYVDSEVIEERSEEPPEGDGYAYCKEER